MVIDLKKIIKENKKLKQKKRKILINNKQKKVQSRRILEESKASYKIPNKKVESVWGDQNRFFKYALTEDDL